MKKFENIILASDIDGTFLWQGQPTARINLEKIKYFTENGGHFTFSSGRNHCDIYKIIPELDALVNLPCVLCNGCFCFDTKTKEIKNPSYLNTEHIIDLLREVDTLSERKIGWRISDKNGFLVSDDDVVIAESLKRNGLTSIATSKPFLELDGREYFKTVFISPSREILENVFSVIREKYRMFTYTRSDLRLFEVMPLGITKATQLEYLKNEVQKKNPDVKLFCVGDYDNDEDMLRFADVGMCPENATDKIKEICKKRLCHCEKGAIADAIDKIEEMI